MNEEKDIVEDFWKDLEEGRIEQTGINSAPKLITGIEIVKKKLNQEKTKPRQKIQLKGTNVIFTFGDKGSGKTTFNTMLYQYIKRQYTCMTNPILDVDIEKFLKKNMSLLKKNIFPLPNNLEKVNENSISFKKSSNRKYLPLTFVDASGELHKSVSIERGAKMSPLLEAYYTNKEVPTIHFLIVGYTDLMRINQMGEWGFTNTEDNIDALFTEFITHLNKVKANKDNVALVITKFDRDKAEGINLVQLVKENLPRTSRLLLDESIIKNPNIFRFSLGQVREIGEGKKTNVINKLDFQDCKPIMDWIITTLQPKSKFMDFFKLYKND